MSDDYSLGVAFSALSQPVMSASTMFSGSIAPAYQSGRSTPMTIGLHVAVETGKHVALTSPTYTAHGIGGGPALGRTRDVRA